MSKPMVGVIGGSGLYQMDGLANTEWTTVKTPFGDPSDQYLVGELAGRRVAFLPRHARGHKYLPSELNYRANVHGFLQLGCEALISLSAVGSMKEALAPGHMVVVDQFVDRTKHRASSFYGEGVVGHVPFGDPVCPTLAKILFEAARAAGAPTQRGGTYICMEGPAFSTRAESNIYRSWGVDVIGMTNLPEAKLAREAGLSYATLAMVTDYDCWREEEEAVSVEAVLATLAANAETARRIVAHAIAHVPAGINREIQAPRGQR